MPPTELPQTSFAVLGLLSFQPMSGYDLKQFADRSIGHFYWSPAKSQIYAELRRLRSEGLVTEEYVEQDTRPDKRVYAITPEGRERLSSWINGSEFEQDVFKSNLMLRVFFGASAQPESLISLLNENLEFQAQELVELKEMESKCLAAEYDAIFSLITIRGGIIFTEAAIQWSKEAIDALEKRVGQQDSEVAGR